MKFGYTFFLDGMINILIVIHFSLILCQAGHFQDKYRKNVQLCCYETIFFFFLVLIVILKPSATNGF